MALMRASATYRMQIKPSKLGRWRAGTPKHLNLAIAWRRAAFSGNTSLIATSSSYTPV